MKTKFEPTSATLILDGANLMQRARFASRKALQGGDNAIVYSFFRSLRPLVDQFMPSKVVLALEGSPVRRLEEHAEYKANRVHDNNDGYLEQRSTILKALEFLPIDVVRHPMHEADDVIAHYVMYDRSDRQIVVSSDSDFNQLMDVKATCIVYNPIKKSVQNRHSVDYVMWKSLVGDSADNIKGFSGVGNKTAVRLLKNPHELEKFLSTPGAREKFERNRSLIKFEDVDSAGISVKRGSLQQDTLKSLFRDLGFWSIVNEPSWKKFIDTFESIPQSV